MAHARGPAPNATAQAAHATRIETDQKTGAILFIVNGREEARIDKTGLHAREGIEYGGTITDTGSADYDRRMAAESKP